MEAQRTYVCTQATPIYQSPDSTDPSTIASNGQAALTVGQIITGQPADNSTIWITSGIGFVPDTTVVPCFSFQVTSQSPIYQSPDATSPIALNGTAQVNPGDTVVGYENAPGWIWLTTGVGFVPMSSVTLQDGQLYTVQSGDNLSTISQQFYGTQVNARQIYEANQAVISDPNMIYAGEVLIIPA